MCNLLFKELATGEGFHPRPWLVSDALHFWATFVHSFNGMVLSVLPIFLCCLPPLNTTMGQISWNFLCVPGYLHLPFSSSKNYLRKSFYVMRRSKLCFWPLRTVVLFDWHRSALRQRKAQGRVIKAAPPGGGRPVPPPCMIWETLISLGTGIPCQMHIEFFILISQNFLELWRG